MVNFLYWPQAFPNHTFETLKECRNFIESGQIPYIKFYTRLGVFIVRQSLTTGMYTLIEHRHPHEVKWYKDYVGRYKKQPDD